MPPAFAIVFITKNVYTADKILIKLYKDLSVQPDWLKIILRYSVFSGGTYEKTVR